MVVRPFRIRSEELSYYSSTSDDIYDPSHTEGSNAKPKGQAGMLTISAPVNPSSALANHLGKA